MYTNLIQLCLSDTKFPTIDSHPYSQRKFICHIKTQVLNALLLINDLKNGITIRFFTTLTITVFDKKVGNIGMYTNIEINRQVWKNI